VAMARLRAILLRWQARAEAVAWARVVAVEWQGRPIGGGRVVVAGNLWWQSSSHGC
jgi:hypothetical protein